MPRSPSSRHGIQGGVSSAKHQHQGMESEPNKASFQWLWSTHLSSFLHNCAQLHSRAWLQVASGMSDLPRIWRHKAQTRYTASPQRTGGGTEGITGGKHFPRRCCRGSADDRIEKHPPPNNNRGGKDGNNSQQNNNGAGRDHSRPGTTLVRFNSKRRQFQGPFRFFSPTSFSPKPSQTATDPQSSGGVSSIR